VSFTHRANSAAFFQLPSSPLPDFRFADYRPGDWIVEAVSMPRLFTGLELPGAVAGQLALMRGGVAGARWLEPEDYHVTLRFIGDTDGRTASDIAETLGDIRRPKALVRFDELSWFGGDKPRAIVAKVKADPTLMDLQAEQERRLRRIGIEPETRKYTPHVTLARLRGVRQAAVANYLAERGALIADSVTAERFVLYSAREGSGGGPYVVEAAYPLD
jgi:RNA 2',3'-cyclic 3'-phosphodiesterase